MFSSKNAELRYHHKALRKFAEAPSSERQIFVHFSDIINIHPSTPEIRDNECLGECFMIAHGMQDLNDEINSQILEDLIEKGLVEKTFVAYENNQDIQQIPVYGLTEEGVFYKNELSKFFPEREEEHKKDLPKDTFKFLGL